MELIDPPDEYENMTPEKTLFLRVQCFYYAAFLAGVSFGLIIMSTNIVFTSLLMLLFGLIIGQQIATN
jgi:hypothetical protein